MKQHGMLLLALILISSLSCNFVTEMIAPPPTLEPYPTFAEVTTPLLFDPSELPPAQKGVAYEVTIAISQNVTPVNNMMINSGSLPAGLEFEFLNSDYVGVIRGIPEESGKFTFTVHASCFGTMVSGQSGQMEYQLVVNE